MDKAFHILTDDDLLQIKTLIKALEDSTLDFLQIESGEVKLTLAKGIPTEPGEPEKGIRVSEDNIAGLRREASLSEIPFPDNRKRPSPTKSRTENTIAVTAPMVGKFYARPEPGAQPFVTLGSIVEHETTVGLLEVMKVFTSVSAGASGTINEICVEDGQFVEFEQILFRVQPFFTPKAGETP